MNLRAYMPLVLSIIIIVAVLGMPLMLASPMDHDMGCPFMTGEMALCATSILLHIQHWQTAFATILVEILVLCALALFFRRPFLATLFDTGQIRCYVRKHTPLRPNLLQELFAQGILNPKIF